MTDDWRQLKMAILMDFMVQTSPELAARIAGIEGAKTLLPGEPGCDCTDLPLLL